MQTNVAENGADLTVAQVMVVLNISQQDIAQLLGVMTAWFTEEGLLPVCPVHVLVHPTSPFPPFGISAGHAHVLLCTRYMHNWTSVKPMCLM